MISVVIPTYNRSALLKRAVDTVLAQTAPASEVIVVDDGSTDDTESVCAAYGDRILYVRQKNAGASVARNTGVNQAGQKWVAFLDSDDYWTPEHLARMERAIHETNGQARYYFSDMQMGLGENMTTLWTMIGFKPPRPVYLAQDGTNWAFMQRQPTMLQCSVFNRQVWMESGGLDPRFRLMHDSEMFFRLGVGKKVCAVAGVGCVQTEDDVSTVRLTTAVNGKTESYWLESLLLWRQLVERFPHMPTRYRRVAKRQVAAVHWRLFRLLSSTGKLGRGAQHLPRLGLADPSFALSLLAHRRADASRPNVQPEYNN